MNEPSDQQMWSTIDQELRAGRKIEAIKAYREARQTDLRTAKEAVEAYAQQAQIEPVREPGKGCLPMLLVAAIVFTGAAFAGSIVGLIHRPADPPATTQPAADSPPEPPPANLLPPAPTSPATNSPSPQTNSPE